MSKVAESALAQSDTDGASVGGQARRRVLLVTGMSGAGRTSALKVLEDLGYEAIDNLPLSLLGRLVGTIESGRPSAIGIDSRTRDFAVGSLAAEIDSLSTQAGLDVKLLFLDCDDEVLRRRFTETRRRHPLALDRPVTVGIEQERELLSPLRDRADVVLDTSTLAPRDFTRRLTAHFGLERAPRLTVLVTSFAYRHGLPRDADLVFDVRFLDNPHHQPNLRALSGRDPEVERFIEADPDFAAWFDILVAMLERLMPGFVREGKSYLTIAIGCTGGRHRSVFVAERLAAWLKTQGRPAMLRHRDLARDPGEFE